jgi:serine/threonine-protein kinase HipA
VRDAGRLKIAKFPHPQDDWDVMAWEATCLNLARRAGIRTPPHLLVRVAGRHVLLLDRFDRTDSGRVGYISAMTLIEGVDGVPRDYTEIAETFPEHAADTTTDLRQLWRRVAFSMIIHNTDDHLRNHGFLAGGGGWTLAPAFDVNPNPDVSAQRATGIGGAYARDDELEGLMGYASTFGLGVDDGRRILQEVLEATAEWRLTASANGIPASQVERFSDAFDGLRQSAQRVLTGLPRI